MKAYDIWYETVDETVQEIVFADTPGRAKQFALSLNGFEWAEFIDLHCRRAKWMDQFANASQMQIDIAKLKHGWNFWLDEGITTVTLDEKSIPMVQKYGSVDGVFGAYEVGELNYDHEECIFSEKEAECND